MKLIFGKKNTIFGVIILAILFAVSLVSIPFTTANTYAAGGNLYITPSTKSVLNGDSFTVQVRANATSGSVAVVDISYPSSSLDLLAYDKSGGFFENEASSPVTSAGHFSVTLFVPGGRSEISADSLVLTLSFRAKAGSGTGLISVDPSSKLYSNGIDVLSSRNGTTITFTSPPPPPVSAPVISSFIANPSNIAVGGSSNLTWSTANSSSCSITPGGPSNTTATSWSTGSLNSIGVINYTLTCKNSSGTSVSKSTPVTIAAASAPKAVAQPPAAASSTTSSTVTSTTATKPATSSTPAVKSAEEYKPPVALTPALSPESGLVESNTLIIKDSSGKLLPNAEVIISTTNYTKTFMTDANGNVVISGVPAGKLQMVIKSKGKQIAKQNVTLVAGVQDTAKEITLAKQPIYATQPLLLPGTALLIVLFAVTIGVLIVIKKRRSEAPVSVTQPIVANSFSTNSFQNNEPPNNQPVVIQPDTKPDNNDISTGQSG